MGTVDGTIEHGEGFVADGRVYAPSHGLEKPMEERANHYVDDTWRFNGDAFAIYENTRNGVRKETCWREDYATEVTIPGPGDAYVSGQGTGTVSDTVSEAFEELSDQGVAEKRDLPLGEGTKRDLEALGYM